MSRTLLRGAHVITMAPDRPDWEDADVLVEGTQIVAVGTNVLPATSHGADAHEEVDVVDCTGRIIMPGLVNAHLHTWQTGLRFIGSDWTLSQYLQHTHGSIARHFRPEDMYIGTLAGAVSQIDGGITTIGDWCHNTPTADHADAAVDGLLQSGVRAVFLHGTSHAAPAHRQLREIDQLLDGPVRTHDLLTLGMAIRGPQLSPAAAAIADFRAAHERGIVVSMHQSGGDLKPAWDAVHKAGLFRPGTNIAHGTGLTDEWVRTLVDAGVTFTTTPENELGQGHGAPITAQLLPLGDAPSLGTDTDCVVAGDLLTSARVALAYQRGLDHDRRRRTHGIFSMEPTVTSKQALSWATLEGARALGLADRVGRLQPGLQADLIVIDTRAPNLWPAHDPIAAALYSSFGNIEAVMIAGHWRKREHTMLAIDLDRINEQLERSSDHIVGQFRDPGPLGRMRGRVVSRVARRRVLKELHNHVAPGEQP
ncbi:amidohydrolase family protein [Kribbella albertanoniae]|uniref:Cytosine deaminase n=1 Tax=Kribbella albertanoniae TaxID=1266829 RepID=A0A4R4PZP8_9ACTN|nr:amidohydrolase family protein [Kribbella albertanoniae]TDC28111.1 cytosine deaminase [Kribbella albertanoniae]